MTKRLMAVLLAASLTANVSAKTVNVTDAEFKLVMEKAVQLFEVAKEAGLDDEQAAEEVVTALENSALLGSPRFSREKQQAALALGVGLVIGVGSVYAYRGVSKWWNTPTTTAPAE